MTVDRTLVKLRASLALMEPDTVGMLRLELERLSDRMYMTMDNGDRELASKALALTGRLLSELREETILDRSA